MTCRIADNPRPVSPQSGADDLARRIDIRPGLTLFLVSLPPRAPFRIDFETDRVPLEFSYHVSGRARYTVHHPAGKSVLTAQPRFGMVCAFPRSHGTMEFFDRDPIRMVAIYMSPQFCHALLADQPEMEDPVLQAFVQGAASHCLCRPSEMSPAMRLAAGQLLDCPYQGATRRLFYESKTLELMALQLSGAFKGPAAPRPVADHRERERIRMARTLLLRDLSNPPGGSVTGLLRPWHRSNLRMTFNGLLP
ncbi:hypothetical protein [Desulfatitalea alkaliphila]|uniref:AraC family transcriptional regulator n=1 Tax=Desulfatitalea alkaliphila TaxID=2929485 RepID=A0AA41R5W2_9BACT|nr:hypothetical protein [Desulfatitalea alkaliphila]MCJ8499748.1 hypothetical protein [Desulfatitalea alkaliphila]